MSETFPSALAQAMGQRNISAIEISKIARVEHHIVEHWLAGRYPSADALARICKILGINEPELIDDMPDFKDGRLAKATEWVENAAQKNKAFLSADKKAKIIALIYQRLTTADDILAKELGEIDSISV